MWVLTCFLRSLSVVKNFVQFSASQLKVLPLWSRSWALNRYSVLNALLHPSSMHSKGFTFVWTLIWIFKLYDVKKALPHPGSVHLNRKSPKKNKDLKRLRISHYCEDYVTFVCFHMSPEVPNCTIRSRTAIVFTVKSIHNSFLGIWIRTCNS